MIWLTPILHAIGHLAAPHQTKGMQDRRPGIQTDSGYRSYS
jgi:hypothetical protein